MGGKGRLLLLQGTWTNDDVMNAGIVFKLNGISLFW